MSFLFPRTLGRTALIVATAMLAAALPSTAAHAAAPARTTAVWIPYWDQARALDSFRDNAGAIAEASPFWYRIAGPSDVRPYSGAEAADVIKAVRDAGAALIPLVSNDFDGDVVSSMLATSSSRTEHVRTLTALAARNGYDGLELDYENLPATDRDRFSAFVRELAAALHADGRTLTVTVHPKTSEPGTWDGPKAQDWAALGAAADRVRVMAYDYHWPSSAPGPIAPAAWVDDVARFAASVIPPSKVQLGVPLYAYDWPANGTASSMMWDAAVARAQQYGAAVRWSAEHRSPFYTYSNAGVAHEVWFENAASVAAKLESVERHGLAGAALWRIGGEDPGVWDSLASPAPAEDTVPPSLAVHDPADGAVLDTPRQTVRFTASDESGIEIVKLYVDGAYRAYSTDGSPMSFWTKKASPGAHTIEVVAIDRAGNETSRSLTATAPERKTPRVQVLSPTAGGTVSAPRQTLRYAVSDDDLKIVKVYVNGRYQKYRTASSAALELSTRGLDPGRHRIWVIAYDRSGLYTVANIAVTLR